MSKKRYGAYKIGMEILFNKEKVTIVGKEKGGKTTEPVVKGGVVDGYKSNPCLYILSNGFKVRGTTIKKHNLFNNLNK